MTHDVFNQAPPFSGHDVSADATLVAGVTREGAGWATGELHRLGMLAGSEQAQEWGRLANEHPPGPAHPRPVRPPDRRGRVPSGLARADDASPSTNGLHAAPWASARPGAHVARAAKFYVWSQVEPGHGCPISMTYASIAGAAPHPDAGGGLRAAAGHPELRLRAARRRSAKRGCSPAWG